jgi:hypothetical protein
MSSSRQGVVSLASSVSYGQRTTTHAPGSPPFAHVLSAHQGVRLLIQKHEGWQSKVAAD